MAKHHRFGAHHRCPHWRLGAAPKYRIHPGREFARQKGFGQVVVGPLLQADDAIDRIALRGEHHDRQIIAGIAQAPQQAEAIFPRQHQIKHQQIGPLNRKAGGKLFGRFKAAHVIAVALQIGAEHLAQVGIVIHHPNLVGLSHG